MLNDQNENTHFSGPETFVLPQVAILHPKRVGRLKFMYKFLQFFGSKQNYSFFFNVLLLFLYFQDGACFAVSSFSPMSHFV